MLKCDLNPAFGCADLLMIHVHKGITSFLLPLQGGLSSVAYVKVDLVDINDNRPTFYPLSYAVSLSTQSAPGTSVVRVMAYDPDSGENGKITYKTVPGGASPYFTLNRDTGYHNYISSNSSYLLHLF